jgi:tRNA 2-thiouridine synthesizing protein A
MSEPTELNTRGLLCPLPVIRTQDAVKKLQPGEQLRVFATDPGTLHDIPAWVRVHGHQLISAQECNDEFHFLITVS